MTYNRVCPRDLFNEANLLKCLGQLYLKTEDMPGVDWHEPQPGEGFHVEQDGSDGSISSATTWMTISGENVHTYRPLNSRDPWPLYCDRIGGIELDEEVAVFTDAGELSAEFIQALAGSW